MLTKLLDTTSFFKTDEVQVTVLEPGQVSGLLKQAAHSEINDYVARLQAEDGFAYLHINAMGAGEFYGPNKNGDYFPESQLIKYHKTFEDTGYVYRHHINKDPAKSMGRVLFSVYNTEMHRVELVVRVDKSKAKDILDRIEAGDFPMTSMACKTPFDFCSICNNKASTRAQYCSHLSNELLKLYPNGQQVMSVNNGPLRFFDISIVIRPADVTSSILQKVANESGEQSDAATVGSAEMAEREGLDEGSSTIKQAAIAKLSELVKQVEGGEVTRVSEGALGILNQVRDLPPQLAVDLHKLGTFNQIVNALAKLGINPSSQFYMGLLSAQPEVTDFVRTRWSDGDFAQMHPNVTFEEPPTALLSALKPYAAGSSLNSDAVEKRAYYWEQAVHTPPAVQKPSAIAAINPKKLAATAAGAMILNQYVTKDKEHRDLIDRLLSLFFGAALISKLSVDELAKTHATINTSGALDKRASTCSINQEFVLNELLGLVV